MEIYRVDRQRASQARGVVIAIDVIRAFTVASYAFAGGARKLWLVRSVEEAQTLRERAEAMGAINRSLLDTINRPPLGAINRPLLAGEVGGRLIPGFDLNNSPSLMASTNVRDRIIIQRTGAGTQGAVDAANAAQLLLCALTNARATALYVTKLAAASDGIITLLPTGTYRTEDNGWNEDELCADYLEALLTRPAQAPDILTKGITYLHTTGRFHRFQAGDSDMPIEDIAAILAVDRFSFAMQGERKKWQDITYVEVQLIAPESVNSPR
jgi:2-phosphosulfolactate phosphatase